MRVDFARVPRVATVLFFLLGATQFFVKWEPGPSEIVTLLLLPTLRWRMVMHPVVLGLFAIGAYACVVEFLLFGGIAWSAISVYLALVVAVILSARDRYGPRILEIILLGGMVGALVTLVLAYAPVDLGVYRYGIRFTGFFKDPNVTAPTAMFFAIAGLAARRRLRWLAFAPAAIFAIALSRGSYIAATATAAIYAVSRRPWAALIVAPVILFVAGNSDATLEVVNGVFASLGRGGLVNFYDQDRLGNWHELVAIWSAEGFQPLGPGFSELNGYAAHSTYLRLLVEQGWVILLAFVVIAVYCAVKADSNPIRYGLIALLINGVIVDATHWRALYIALALALASARDFDGTGERQGRELSRSGWRRARPGQADDGRANAV